MYSHILIYFFLLKLGYSQLNGEFWWLNNKFASYIGTRPPPPRFENLSELDTDENANIIFRDHSQETADRETTKQNYNYMHNNFKWPNVNKTKIFYNHKNVNDIGNQYLSKYEHGLEVTNDKFTFRFPEKQYASPWKESIIAISTIPSLVTPNKNKPTEKPAKNIGTNIKKNDCKRSNCVQINNIEYETKQNINLTCCIPPLKNKKDLSPSIIYFPDMLENIKKRFKRSNGIAHKQRDVLLKRRYRCSSQKPEIGIKISTPDYEYNDPYWNIRNVKNPNKQEPESSTIYNTEDYVEDYVVELPKPGLIGVYSDNANRPPGWTLTNSNKGSSYDGEGDTDDYDDGVSSFGYSTINPRFESNTHRVSKPRPTPMRVTSSSEELAYDVESQTINYNSNPDFNVLQGFKLLNFLRDKNKSKTTESVFDNDSKESILSSSVDTHTKIENDNENNQVFENCGQAVIPQTLRNPSKQFGNTQNGSHPWLALLVPSENLNNFLCYATIIHPRAAITAASCVHRKEIKLIAGLWNLNERSYFKTRLVSAMLHPKYKIGELSNNLAIVHWKRPLKLGVNIQPICLSNLDLDCDYMFVGWGGFDQVLQPRSQWQRSSIHTCKDRLSLNSINIPKNGFCASVETRSTVTGVGGSLVCNIKGRLTAVGMAVSRDSTIVLLPINDWVMEVIGVLKEE